jgi:MFS family permease
VSERRPPFAQTFIALRHRNFRLYAAGQLVSMIGTWLQSVAQSWLVYRLTGSSMLLGLVSFSLQIPVFLLAPFGGTIADRTDRRKLLLVTQSLAGLLALVLGAVTLAHIVTIRQLFVFAVLLGIVNAFDQPTRQAFVSQMVTREDLHNAIALNSSIVNSARVLGPAIAGVLVATVGEGWCFVLNGLSFAAVIAALAAMRLAPLQQHPRGSPLQEIRSGLQWVVEAPPIHSLLLLVGIVSLFGMPYVVLMPIFADKILGGGPKALGILMGSTGIGALVGALTLASREGARGLGRWVVASAAGFGAALILFAFSRAFWLSAAVLTLAGFSMVLQLAASNTLLQTLTPDRLRGRVMAFYAMMFFGMAPFGSLWAGSTASRIGAPATVIAGGAISVLAALFFTLRLPKLRIQARELLATQEAAAGEPIDEVLDDRD